MKIKCNIIKALTVLVLIICMSISALAYGDSLVPVGRTVGIDLSFGGVMVAELTDVDGQQSPAAAAGLQKGDIITHIGQTRVRCASDFVEAAEDFDGGGIKLELLRKGESTCVTVKPIKGDDGVYRLGLWLRDGISGIGTVTFYDPETGLYGALGHGINDPET
ncbi:MAG: PDZ domain-containing protein, partial [Oscillospiraceae bacterium]|nr:PDZ domain-containing protein [Oscillospiraceae bacterium]